MGPRHACCTSLTSRILELASACCGGRSKLFTKESIGPTDAVCSYGYLQRDGIPNSGSQSATPGSDGSASARCEELLKDLDRACVYTYIHMYACMEIPKNQGAQCRPHVVGLFFFGTPTKRTLQFIETAT